MASLSPSKAHAEAGPDRFGAETNQADIALLHRLVEIQSLSGAEDAAAGYLVGQMAERGFRAERDRAGNAVGHIGGGDRHVVLLGHIDTVPGRIPARVEDGVLWGRGAVDAKGPLATFVAAASRVADRLNATVTVVGAVGEETMGSPGASEVATWDAPDFCIIGEPSSWDAVCLGYRGTVSLQYVLRKDSRHTAGPGGSVGEEAIAFWQRLTEELERINLGVAGDFGRIGASLRSFNTAGDGLSDTARLSIGLRLPPGREVDELIAHLSELAGDAEIAVDGYQLAYRTDKRSRLVPPFLRAIRAEGGTPRFTLKLGTSDMTVVGPAWGCPIVAYGPGDASLDHTPDERIVLDDYLRAVRVLANVLAAL